MRCHLKTTVRISWELMVERMNSDLANTLGNLVNRTVSMSNKYFGGVVENKNVNEPVDEELKKVVLETPNKVIAKWKSCVWQMRSPKSLHCLNAATNTSTRQCRGHWQKTRQKERLATVLYNLVESISIGATLLESFMPETSDKVLAQLGAQKRKLSQMDTFGLYPSGNKVTEKPEILFARMDINEVMAKLQSFIR